MNSVASGSVCPQKWTLPIPSDLSYLITTIYNLLGSEGSANLQSVPLSFNYTGYYLYNPGMLDQTSNGWYWSRTASSKSASSAYGLMFSSAGISPQADYFDRGLGIPIRCLAKP